MVIASFLPNRVNQAPWTTRENPVAEVATLAAAAPVDAAFHASEKAGARHVRMRDADGRLRGLLGIADRVCITLSPAA